MTKKLFPFVIAAFALLGCADPMIGRWESRENPELDLEVREGGGTEIIDYVAEGHIYICSESYCEFCAANFQLKHAGTDRYEVQGQGNEGCFTGWTFRGGYCTLAEDSTTLDCTLGDGDSTTYAKVDD